MADANPPGIEVLGQTLKEIEGWDLGDPTKNALRTRAVKLIRRLGGVAIRSEYYEPDTKQTWNTNYYLQRTVVLTAGERTRIYLQTGKFTGSTEPAAGHYRAGQAILSVTVDDGEAIQNVRYQDNIKGDSETRSCLIATNKAGRAKARYKRIREYMDEGTFSGPNSEYGTSLQPEPLGEFEAETLASLMGKCALDAEGTEAFVSEAALSKRQPPAEKLLPQATN